MAAAAPEPRLQKSTTLTCNLLHAQTFMRRPIRHPLFKNVDAAGAIDHLRDHGDDGDCVFRPSHRVCLLIPFSLMIHFRTCLTGSLTDSLCVSLCSCSNSLDQGVLSGLIPACCAFLPRVVISPLVKMLWPVSLAWGTVTRSN